MQEMIEVPQYDFEQVKGEGGELKVANIKEIENSNPIFSEANQDKIFFLTQVQIIEFVIPENFNDMSHARVLLFSFLTPIKGFKWNQCELALMLFHKTLLLLLQYFKIRG